MVHGDYIGDICEFNQSWSDQAFSGETAADAVRLLHRDSAQTPGTVKTACNDSLHSS